MISEFEQVVIFGSFIYLIGICRCFKINPGFLLYLLFKVSLSNLFHLIQVTFLELYLLVYNAYICVKKLLLVTPCSVCLGELRVAAWLFPTKLCFKFRLLNMNKFLIPYAKSKGNQSSCSKYVVLP